MELPAPSSTAPATREGSVGGSASSPLPRATATSVGASTRARPSWSEARRRRNRQAIVQPDMSGKNHAALPSPAAAAYIGRKAYTVEWPVVMTISATEAAAAWRPPSPPRPARRSGGPGAGGGGGNRRG